MLLVQAQQEGEPTIDMQASRVLAPLSFIGIQLPASTSSSTITIIFLSRRLAMIPIQHPSMFVSASEWSARHQRWDTTSNMYGAHRGFIYAWACAAQLIPMLGLYYISMEPPIQSLGGLPSRGYSHSQERKRGSSDETQLTRTQSMSLPSVRRLQGSVIY